jgi:hypothetical protein
MVGMRSRRVVSLFGALLASALIACGGDDDTGGSGNAQGGQGGAAATPTRLADHTAGKACTSAKDCAGGTCTQSFQGNALLGQGEVQAPGGYCSFECKLNADCGADGICIGAMQGGGFFGIGGNNDNDGKGMCMQRCVAASQCREGYRCIDTNNQVLDGDPSQPIPDTSTGSCQVLPPTDKLTGDTVGAMCSSDDDCAGGTCGMSNMFSRLPGGYCTGRCLQDSDCGDNGVCTPGAAGGTGSCYRKCTKDSDCGRDGYRCRASGTDSGSLCEPGVKPLPDQTSGKACAADADCGGNAMSCVTTTSGRNPTTYPGGYCTQTCVDNSDCGAGGVCTGPYAAFGMGSCYKTCSAASDCRDGYTCRALQQGGMGMAATTAPTVCALPPAMRPTDRDAGTDLDAGM